MSLTSAKMEKPFPSASTSGQTNPQSLCLSTRARAWVEGNRERAQTTATVGKNMAGVYEEYVVLGVAIRSWGVRCTGEVMKGDLAILCGTFYRILVRSPVS